MISVECVAFYTPAKVHVILIIHLFVNSFKIEFNKNEKSFLIVNRSHFAFDFSWN